MWHGQQMPLKLAANRPTMLPKRYQEWQGMVLHYNHCACLELLVLGGEIGLGGSHLDGILLPITCLCRSVNWDERYCPKGENKISEMTQDLLHRLL